MPDADVSAPSILAFWRMLELLNPQPLPALTPKATSRDSRVVVELSPRGPVPWETPRSPTPLRGKRRLWRHTVYLGLYSVQDTYEFLHRAFYDERDSYDERPAGRSACAALLLDERGRVIPEATVLSSAAWAVGRLRDPGPSDPSWSIGFTDSQRRFVDEVQQLETTRQERAGQEHPLSLDRPALSALLDTAHRAAGVSGISSLATAHVLVASTVITEDAAANPGIDFLNSFHLSDLEAVHADVVAHGPRGPLAAYLTPDSVIRASQRVDVVASPEVVDHGLRVERLPKGRWPTDPRHHLARSQQFAVNEALGTLGPQGGLLGVNGPPGTGKTTMLRDVLAGNVVERACVLARLENPHQAFRAERHQWNQEGRPRSVRQLIPELTGFEMVVASSNNAAVENVSTTLPRRGELGERWRTDADYFGGLASLAQTVVGSSEDEGANDTLAGKDDLLEAPAALSSAWGLVAARLGRSAHRASFRSIFWFGRGDGADSGEDVQSMQQWLQDRVAEHVPRSYWADARTRFTSSLETVEAMVAARAAAEARPAELRSATRSYRELSDWIEHSGAWLTRLQADVAAARANVDGANHDVDLLTRRRLDHVAVRPGFWESLTSFGRSPREWRSVLTAHDEAIASAVDRASAAAAREEAADRELSRYTHEVEEARQRLTRAGELVAELEVGCAQDRERYGDAYPDITASPEQRELRASWLDEELDTARSDLFVAAMNLHRDFFASVAKDMLTGLRAATEVVAGKAPPALEPEKVRAAWQLFFLVVPLVSTTFSSLGRMFDRMGRDSIGWLIVDEAGQACPQHAVGGIWRARRVLAVGDPLQLEPVATAPRKLVGDIAATWGVSSGWIPPLASVQTLADRVTRHGTTLPQGENDVWVGSPLRVHRRCDDPMFTLSNTMAYDGLMIHATPKRGRAAAPGGEADPFNGAFGPVVAPSYWADVPAVTSGSHLQPTEIERVRRALDWLDGCGVPSSDVIAISPFRAVADALERLSHETRYSRLTAGTVHTAQGKEAPVVLLVLGGDPGRPGARAWATSRVNLFNVAVSRAQRRLYVIGDHALWKRFPYAELVARTLPVRRLGTLAGEEEEPAP